MCQSMQKCYPAGQNKWLTIVGYVLLAAGLILLFVCIPGWAWAALIGVALIAAGGFLLRLSNAWR